MLGYDGALLRLADTTPGRPQPPRMVAVEAFAEEFTTGTSNFYPRHLPRNDSSGYLQDLSAWSGDSAGYRHVRLKLPGMAGSSAQLSFEFTQDSIFTCADVRPGHRCGVLLDNIVVRSVVSTSPTNVTLSSSANPSMPGQPVLFTATVTTANGTFATDGSVTFREGATVLAGPIAIAGNGQAAFTTSSLALGSHTITADYTSSSGLLAPASASIVQQVLAGMSIDDVTLSEGASGIQSATFTVSLAQPSPFVVTAQYATADGTASLADFDYSAASGTVTFQPGQTAAPIVVSVFGDSRFETDETFTVNLAGPTNAFLVDAAGVGTIVNDDPPGPTVDEATVNQAIVSAGNRLRTQQNADGGWYFVVPATDCGRGAGVSCPNITGATALGLLAAYTRSDDPLLLDAATTAGDQLVELFADAMTQTPPDLPHPQDMEFLAALGQLTGDPAYATTAQGWFQVLVDQYPLAADAVDLFIADRERGHQRSLAAWDTAAFIRSAKAVGNAGYALGLATRIREREADWKYEDAARRDQCPDLAGCGPADNKLAHDFTILGEGSLLWAFHDLPGFEPQQDAYRAFLLANQDPAGSWDAGDPQVTAYVVLGLAAVGGAQTEAAMRSAAAYYLSTQLANGGWLSDSTAPEVTEVDSEIARALWTLFNTPEGQGVSVTPAQLSSITFAQVLTAGMTSVFGIDHSKLPPLPAGYTLLQGLGYQITTTASISGSLTACFIVPWVNDTATFANLRILQSEGGTLVDRTILPPSGSAPDFAARRVCAVTSSLSPFAIAVRDATAPTLSLTLSPAMVWPPDGKMVTITASIEVHDDSDPAPRVELVSITSNNTDRRQRADVQNAVFGTDDRQFDVRTEPGRRGVDVVYTVIYRATDTGGNSTEAIVRVRVVRAASSE